jgi:hypothetical protein
MGKFYLTVGLVSTILGGYLYGYIYAPQRWRYVPVGDWETISIGCVLGCLVGTTIVLILDIWKSSRGS